MKDIISKLKLQKKKVDGFLVNNLPGLNSFMIGVDSNNFIVFLIKPKDNFTPKQPTSSRGKFLDVSFDTECEITTSDGDIRDNYTILSLKSDEEIMERLFLNVCSDLSKLIGDNPEYIDVINVVSSLRDLFSKFLKGSKKEEIGMWGELFMIYISSNKELLIDSWHINPKDTFDFNDGNRKLEIKTTTRNERIHAIKLNQILKSIESDSLICSIMTSQIELGVSVLDLIDDIASNVSVQYKQRLMEKVFESAGDNFIKFVNNYDLKTAELSYKFYEAEKIPSIDKKCISKEVSNVKFDVSLESILDKDITEINEGLLSKFN